MQTRKLGRFTLGELSEIAAAAAANIPVEGERLPKAALAMTGR